MRRKADMPSRGRGERRGSRRWRLLIAIGIGVLLVLLFSLRSLARLYTDYLWFDSLGFASVWEEIFFARIILALIFITIMFVLLWVNLYLVDRLAPPFRPAGPEEEFLRRYHETIGRRAGLVRFAVSGLFAFAWGITAGGRWSEWILFRNGVDFGVEDPQFGRDISFYVFELPFIQFVVDWLFTALLFTLVITIAAHYLNGGIRINAATERVTSQVKVHVSVLLSALALTQAVDYWYQRYALTLSTRGAVDGATYTDVNAQLPALALLILISLCAAVLLIVNVRRRGWVLPAVAVGLWAFTAVVVGGIYPAVYQRFIVEPSESNRESDFIARNIEATRVAYNMVEVDDDAGPAAATVTSVSFPLPDDDLTPEMLADNADSIENIRLLDPNIVAAAYEKLEAERPEYRFTDDLDVDRYEIDGVIRPVIIGARQLDTGGIPGGTWENQHLSFTHGYGAALAPANQLESGRPDFVVGGLPTEIDTSRFLVEIDQPRIYIGEDLDGFAIVNTDRTEVDFPLGNTNETTVYSGADGVRVGGLFRRVAFALRFGDVNPVFSGFLNSDSRIIFNRDVEERAKELAPFLAFDADPYPVLVDSRIKWVLDAYTTTHRYPYSQQVNLDSVPNGSGLRTALNYVRNSVKVVTDAYDGTITFYIVDPSDPIVRAYQKAFPSLFTDGALMPNEIRQHLRYPEDLFRVQTNMWGKYHIDVPIEFFDPTQAWSPAQDPGTELRAPDNTDVNGPSLSLATTSNRRIDPYYLQMRLPGEDEPEFVLYRPFVPAGSNNERQELTAFMVARNDPEHYGQLVVYEMPSTTVDGPALANANMLADAVVAEETTLLGQRGSAVDLGNMILVPVEDNLIWVRPLYVSGGDNSVPTLTNVLVSYNDIVRICPRLDLALAALFVSRAELEGDRQCRSVEATASQIPAAGDIDPAQPGVDADDPASEPPEPEPPEPDPAGPDLVQIPQEVADLLSEAEAAFAAADEALADGDGLAVYENLIAEGRAKLRDALAALDELAAA